MRLTKKTYEFDSAYEAIEALAELKAHPQIENITLKYYLVPGTENYKGFILGNVAKRWTVEVEYLE